jgi:hypothetical protein
VMVVPRHADRFHRGSQQTSFHQPVARV